jgi:glucan-binding YG repeat protein
MSEEDLKNTEEAVTEDSGVEVDVESTAETEKQEERVEAQKPEQESGDDELESYSKNVQKRIKKLTEKYRQEERDRAEAVRIAQALKNENDQLRNRVQNLDSGYLTEYGSRLESQLEQAKAVYRDAHDRGDVDKMFEAQQALNKISIEQERHRIAQARQQQAEQRVQVQQPDQRQQQAYQQPQQPQPQEPDPKAKGWAEKNDWFGQDEVMTYAAFGIHRKLVEEEGFDPTSDEYYNEIDSRMRREFPNRFGGKKSGGSQVAAADTSASRNKSGRRTVKLSPSQVAIAKKLGVPLEEYAKYVKD